MIKLVAGDTVLVKHPKFTDGKWKKKKIYVADSGFYEIRFSTGDSITVCKEPDKLDKATGFLLAVLKEILDNKSYGNILEKIDEFSKQDIMADLNNKTELHHCSIKDLKERTEALENVYVPGSVVKFKNGKKNYMVISYRFDEQLKEMVYILRPYKGAWYSDLEGTRKKNVPHSRLIMVRRK